MALRKIHTYPSEVLRKKTGEVEDFGPELQELIDDMIETMYAAPGIGLAAPQVGVSRKLIVIDLSSGTDPDQVLVLANPEIVSSEGEEGCEEGCLSLPELSVKVRRHSAITVKGHDRLGREVVIEGEGLASRALQHEIDHLNGVLIVDHLHPLRREMVKKKLRKAVAS